MSKPATLQDVVDALGDVVEAVQSIDRRLVRQERTLTGILQETRGEESSDDSAIACPHCGETEDGGRGIQDTGTAKRPRLTCLRCGRSFRPDDLRTAPAPAAAPGGLNHG